MSNKPLSGTDKLWADLTGLDPADVCRRTGADFRENAYVVPFMGGGYSVSLESRSVSVPAGRPTGNGELELLLLAYLVDAAEIEPTGKWISEKEVPGGSLFFTGPHKMPVGPIAAKYGSNPEAFLTKACEHGGTALEFGDASAAFNALPRIPCAFVLWAEDDEFPAEVTVMFDETVAQHIPVDVILALTGSVVRYLL